MRQNLIVQLQERQQELVLQIQQLRKGLETEKEVGDVIDTVQVESASRALVSTIGTLSGELHSIEARLAGLASSPSITLCSDCGGRIAIARLRAVPSTTRCRGCQEDKEKGSGPRITPRIPYSF